MMLIIQKSGTVRLLTQLAEGESDDYEQCSKRIFVNSPFGGLKMTIKKLLITMHSLQLILKIKERYNLNCSYCYYLNGLDQRFKNQLPLISQNILEEVIKFVVKGIKELEIKQLRFFAWQ